MYIKKDHYFSRDKCCVYEQRENIVSGAAVFVWPLAVCSSLYHGTNGAPLICDSVYVWASLASHCLGLTLVKDSTRREGFWDVVRWTTLTNPPSLPNFGTVASTSTPQSTSQMHFFQDKYSTRSTSLDAFPLQRFYDHHFLACNSSRYVNWWYCSANLCH